jgi:sn-glycerol 3-phosphate transport system ATP-binding protein
MAAVELQQVSKRFGETVAVDSVSFEVPLGSFAVLLGPSGCGKSTTLRMVAGLEPVTDGRVLIAGNDVTDAEPAQRGVSMVFQSYALFPHLSVGENILFGLRVRRVPAAERARRLAGVLDLLGLGALVERRPSQLSGGQQQRVALGRAIIAQAPVCLMDEPLSNLDAQLRHEMRREIRALQRKLGITMLFVTHDQVEAMSMADHVILLRGGRIEQHATPAGLYARPDTAFAARFIGTPPMNLVELADAPDGARIAGTDGPALTPLRGQALLAGLRPESLSLVGDGGVAATVDEAEYLGADTLLACRAGAGRLVLRQPGRIELGPGAPIRIGWHAGDLHFFDAATGRRRDDVPSIGTIGAQHLEARVA